MKEIFAFLERTAFSLGDQQVTLGQMLFVPTLVIVGLLLTKWLVRIVSNRLASRNVNPDVIHLVRRIFYILAVAVLFMTLLDLINVPLTAFAFVSGAVAIGVGFGAQNIINNFISGWILMWERPIRIGDFLEVGDARGQNWYSKSYSTQTGVSSYSINRDRRLDPYQKIFNDIANDLRAHVAQMTPKAITDIQHVSELQFFADMSPEAYGEHLAQGEDGIVSAVRLPAENDPAVDRLRQIRERDRLVVDTLNEHYANFYYGIAIPYRSWRKTAREESINYRQVRRSANLQTLMGAVVLAGSLAANTDSGGKQTRNINRSLQGIGIQQGFESMFGGISRRSEANIHLESIKELSESFGAEAAPMVVSVEGESRRLTGTAAAQYESWRRLLKQIYESETGFVEPMEDNLPERVPEPTG